MKILILAGGLFNIAFIVFHVMFWRLFDWPADLKSLTFVNRQVMQILNICLIVAFAIFAYISLIHTTELIETNIGRTLLALIAAFWWFRAVQQIYFFGFKNRISIIFFLIFAGGGFLYAIPWYVVLTVS